jgi:hypothetical protein
LWLNATTRLGEINKKGLMTDQQTGEQEPVEAPTQDIPESESSEEVVDQQQPTEAESPELETGKNEVDNQPPKDNAAWAAMRVENQRLKEAVSQVDPEYLERLRGATRNQEYAAPQVNQIAEDAEYSEVTRSLNWTQQQAAIANQKIAQLQNQLELQQDRQAEEAFPELKTDKVFQQIVAEKKLAARVLGHDRTTSEIAREVKSLLGRREEQLTAQVVQTTRQQDAETRAAIAEPRSTSSQGQSAANNEEVRHRVRKGDQDAQLDVARGLIADLEF